MNPKHLYTGIVYSLVKKLLDEMPDGWEYIDWDAHAEIHELPAVDKLIGLSGVSLANDGEEIRVVFAVGVATQNDPNLFNLRGATSEFYGVFAPETRVDVYDKVAIDDGADVEPSSWMVMTTPIEILPINRAEIRNVQFINCSALLNPKAAE